MSGPRIEVQGLSRRFAVPQPWLDRLLNRGGRRWIHAVDGVAFTLEAGRTLALVGESGCGKSTVARMMVGLLAPSAGEVRLDGRPIVRTSGTVDEPTWRRRVQMIFQDPMASLNPRWRVGALVAEPIRALEPGCPPREVAARVQALLQAVGLGPGDAGRFPHEFSGGQRQRICIARALATGPDVLVCDEPTSALDVSVQAQVLNLMRRLQRERGLTYLFISHNLAVVRHVADAVGVMYLGHLVERAPKARLFERPAHPYTRMLLEAIPDLSMSGRVRQPIQGEVPSPLAPPAGCPFHPRCPWAQDRCSQERPLLREAGAGHWVACHFAL